MKTHVISFVRIGAFINGTGIAVNFAHIWIEQLCDV